MWTKAASKVIPRINLALSHFRMPIVRPFGYVFFLAVFACSPANSGAQSLYTSIKSEDCQKPSASILAFYDSRGLTVEECKGVEDWRLFVVSSDARSWLELARERTLWSSEDQVVNRNEFGNFPNIGSEKVEWLMSNHTPVSLIFRIAAQDPENVKKSLSRLFVIGFKNNTPQFCGVVKANTEARALAEKTSSCSTGLQVKDLPRN